jgi:hypothetical protein
MNLCEACALHGTDKSLHKHAYCEVYEKFFNPLKDKPISLLEIGVLSGKSLKAWKDYFTQAQIVGLDIENKKQYEEDRIRTIMCSQVDFACMDGLIQQDRFDIMIDDGSHNWSHQIKSFEFLFPRLKSGGMYVIEDLHSSYGNAWYTEGDTMRTTDYLKGLVDIVNHFGNFKHARAKKDIIKKPNLDFKHTQIKSISFYTSMCFIEKF